MTNFIKRLKHYFGKCDWVCIAEGEEPTGGQLFGGAFHWSRYECSICHEVSSTVTETL